MRDRDKRRSQRGKNPQQPQEPSRGPAPLQPTFLDRESNWGQNGEAGAEAASEGPPQPEYEAQPEKDPFEAEGEREAFPAGRRTRSRRRGRGGRGRGRGGQRQKAPHVSGLPIDPGQATGEAAEIDAPEEAAEAAELEPALAEAGSAPQRAAAAKGAAKEKKGAVVLSIGLPGSGKSSWFKRHNIIPLSSDLVRGLLFDDATEQRYQDLVFSSLRSLLRARLISGRPMSYIDATYLSPKERHSWIKMAQDFGYEAHAVFFDVPTEVCMERNRKRSRNVPDDVMLRMAQKLRPPKFDEGFAKVTVVRLKNRRGAADAAAPEAEAASSEPAAPADEGLSQPQGESAGASTEESQAG
jgi:predicted kinase